jgi:carbonic anhydrase
MLHKQQIQNRIRENDEWATRRKLGIPNNKRLFVIACMDERLPVEQALGLEPGDAHVFRNAGGFATDDAIRSAALSIHFFGTREIVIVNHTDCGMLSAAGRDVSKAIEEKTGVDLTQTRLDPDLESLLNRDQVDRWWKMQPDIESATRIQIEAFRRHPLIPKEIAISGYVYDVNTGHLREVKQVKATPAAGAK